MPSPWRLTTWGLAAFVLGASVGTAPSAAHPHVRIKVEIAFEVHNGALLAIRERWTFDEAFLQSNLEEFDTNKNGILDPDEIEAFRRLSDATMKRFGNFTAVSQGDLKIQTGDATFIEFSMTAPRPIVEFRTTLTKAITLSKPVQVDVYDPTYYSAFDIAADQVVIAATETIAACSARVAAPAGASRQMADYRSFVASLGPLAARLVKPQSITLSCTPGTSTTGLIAIGKPEKK